MNIGFIDYFLDEWHANHLPAWIQKASEGRSTVTHAFALIDSPFSGGKTTADWCRTMGIAHCATIEEVVASCDALVVLSPDNAEMHEQLCQLPLRSGKPTYVDKTFAPDGATARRLLALADASGTPCFTSSALRFAPEYQGIDRAGLRGIASWGPGKLDTYAIHQVEPIVMLMDSAATRVQYLPGDGFYTLMMEFLGGRYATMSGLAEGSPFMMNLCIGGGNQVAEAKSDFFAAFTVDLMTFFENRRVPVPHAQTLAIMDILEAGKKAANAPGTWVSTQR